MWSQFLYKLSFAKNFEIPRFIFKHDVADQIEIHGFADASTKGFGAAIYTKTNMSHNDSHVSLLCSKTKVAPLKTISLPRLELSAPLLLARLLNKVKPEFKQKINQCYLWTDSMIVLAWISASPHNWQTFVANRVSEIQSFTTECEWRHVSSSDNLADLITRGLYPDQIVNNTLWWSGPEWLANNLVIGRRLSPF